MVHGRPCEIKPGDHKGVKCVRKVLANLRPDDCRNPLKRYERHLSVGTRAVHAISSRWPFWPLRQRELNMLAMHARIFWLGSPSAPEVGR